MLRASELSECRLCRFTARFHGRLRPVEGFERNAHMVRSLDALRRAVSRDFEGMSITGAGTSTASPYLAKRTGHPVSRRRPSPDRYSLTCRKICKRTRPAIRRAWDESCGCRWKLGLWRRRKQNRIDCATPGRGDRGPRCQSSAKGGALSRTPVIDCPGRAASVCMLWRDVQQPRLLTQDGLRAPRPAPLACHDGGLK